MLARCVMDSEYQFELAASGSGFIPFFLLTGMQVHNEEYKMHTRQMNLCFHLPPTIFASE